MLSPSQLQESLSWPRSARCELLFDLAPFDYQTDLINDPSGKVAANLARRSGKTTISGAHVGLACIERPGIDAAVFAPTNSQAKEAFREVAKCLKAACRGVRGLSGEFNKTELTLSNGSRAFCMTLGSEQETSRGRGPEVVWIDEAALIDEQTINRVVRPMQLTHSDPSLWLTSTPRGKSGYFYDVCRPESNWSVHHATAWDNPLVDPDELRAIRSETDSLSFQMEYLAEFADDGSSYLPRELVDPCVSESIPDTPTHPCYLACDPARHGVDRSAYVLVDSEGRVVHSETVDTERTQDTLAKIHALSERFSPSVVLIDDSSGVSDLAQEELPNARGMVFSTKRKQSYFQALRRLLESRSLTLPAGDLPAELVDLEYRFTETGLLKIHARSGGKDDLADALAMACFALDRGVSPPRIERDVSPPTIRRSDRSQARPSHSHAR